MVKNTQKIVIVILLLADNYTQQLMSEWHKNNHDLKAKSLVN